MGLILPCHRFFSMRFLRGLWDWRKHGLQVVVLILNDIYVVICEGSQIIKLEGARKFGNKLVALVKLRQSLTEGGSKPI